MFIFKEKASQNREVGQSLSFMQATPTNQTIIITKSYSVQNRFLPSLCLAPDKIHQHL